MPDPTWNLIDQDCDAFDDSWTNHACGGTGTVTLVTEDSRSCYKLYTPGGVGNYAMLCNHDASIALNGDYTFQFVYKHATNAHYSGAGYTHFQWNWRESTRYSSYWSWIDTSTWAGYLATLYYEDSPGSGPHFCDTWGDITTSMWNTVRIVRKSDYLYLWINGICLWVKAGPVATGYSFTPWMWFVIHNDLVTPITMYIDDIKLSSTAKHPDTVHPMKFRNDDGTNIDIVSCIAYASSTKPEYKTRFYKTNLNITATAGIEYIRRWGFPLVATTHEWASPIRINDNGTIKSLTKNPNW